MSVVVNYEVENCHSCPYAVFVYKDGNVINKMICSAMAEAKEIPIDGIREDCPYNGNENSVVYDGELII